MKVEKVYVLQGEDQIRHMEEMLSAIPLECIQAANEIVDYATISLGKALSNYLYLNLCDHIYFAIKRFREGIPLQNALLTEIRRFYSHEYEIGLESLQIVRKRTGVSLPEDEAGFIAMHLVNAEMDFNDMGNTQEMMKIIRHILNIVRYHFHVDLDEESIHYDRFITHLKFFVKRVFSGQELDENDESFFIMFKNQYKEEYACVLKVYEYIRKEYGILLTNDEIMYLISACIGGAVGGLFMGFFTVKNYGGGSPGLMTLPGYIGGDSLRDLMLACVGAAIAFVITFIISFVLYKDQEDEETAAAPATETAEEKGEKAAAGAVTNICSPVKGRLAPLSEVNDPTFAEEILGKGVAVIPEDGNFFSPVKGTIQAVFDTKHAIGIVSDTGVEVLIHVGLDTVNLKGKFFDALVKTGDAVDVGTPILKVDLNGVKSAGYDIIPPVLVTNTADCGDVIGITEGSINPEETIIKVNK